MYQLLVHQFLEKKRSPFWQKSIILNFLLGILALYLLLNIVFIGLYADQMIGHFYPNSNVIEAFTGLLFYYFTFDLFFRFLAQQLPVLSMQPYLTLPLKRSMLLHYPLIKSITSFFNVLALLLILPFFIKNICPASTPLFCISWILTVLSFITINNFLNFLLKKYFSKNPLVVLGCLVIIGGLIYLEISKIVSVSSLFSSAIFCMKGAPYLVVIPVAVAVLSYYMAYALLKRNRYLEDNRSGQINRTGSLTFLNRYGEMGDLTRIIHQPKNLA